MVSTLIIECVRLIGGPLNRGFTVFTILLIGQKNTKVFWHQSEARTAATVWNWSGKTFSQGIFSPFFTFFRAIFSRPFRLSLAPTICPWVSEDVYLLLSQWIPVLAPSYSLPLQVRIPTSRQALFSIFVGTAVILRRIEKQRLYRLLG